jgi:hypothetical protein
MALCGWKTFTQARTGLTRTGGNLTATIWHRRGLANVKFWAVNIMDASLLLRIIFEEGNGSIRGSIENCGNTEIALWAADMSMETVFFISPRATRPAISSFPISPPGNITPPYSPRWSTGTSCRLPISHAWWWRKRPTFG